MSGYEDIENIREQAMVRDIFRICKEDMKLTLLVCVFVAFLVGLCFGSAKEQLSEKVTFMKKEIVYLDDNFTADNAKWKCYKDKVDEFSNKATNADDSKAGQLLTEAAELHETLPLRLPSGPAGAGEFGAYYTQLKYSLSWDQQWHVSDYPDVVVRFDDYDHRFVFWRGTSFIPCWATYDGPWYTNEFFERRGFLGGCSSMCEPMSDKQARYSHARIIESTDARVVVHWRYSPVDLEYVQPYRDKMTGWGDWVDEYYYLYPDSVGVRKATIHTSSPVEDWIEYQESIVINQPHSMPEDSINFDAVSYANLKGQSVTYTWTKDGGPDFDNAPDEPVIQVINFKNDYKPFSVVHPGGVDVSPYSGHGKGSYFNWWNHWPVAQEKSDTTVAESAAKPSHSSLSQVKFKEFSRDGINRTWLMLNGMTDKKAAELVPMAKSWLYPAKLELKGKGFISEGYDQTQRAYILAKNGKGRLGFSLQACENNPLVNVALVVKGWGDSKPVIKLNDKKVKMGKNCRVGYIKRFAGDDMVLWLRLESVKPVDCEIAGM